MSFHGDFLKYQYRLLQLLQSCSKLRAHNTTKPLHALTITISPNPEQSTFVYNNIISFYASFNQVPLAHKVFDNMPQRNKVSYNSIISCFSKYGYLEEAWRTFCAMIDCGFRPNNFTLSGLLSCASMDVSRGIMLQALAIKNGLFCSDAFVGTALLGLFGRCGWLDEAFHVFEDMPNKSLVTWNSMISLLGHHGFVEDSVVLFRKLVRKEGSLSKCSFEGVLSGLVFEEDLEFGGQIHGLVIKSGFDCEVLVSNSLINMYARCSSMSQVEKLFEEVDGRDVVTWNTIISAFSKSKNPGKALEVFLKMSEDGIMPNQTTFLEEPDTVSWNIVIAACARNGNYSEVCNLALGSSIHGLLIKTNFRYFDIVVRNVLIDMYGKCGNLESSVKIFDSMTERNLITWTALISALGINGCAQEALERFNDMEFLGSRPDKVAFIAVLTACRHGALVREGMQLFGKMNNYHIEPDMDHYHCLVDLLARNGHLEEAEKVISCMPFPPDAQIWRSFLEGCKKRRNTEDHAVCIK
ncbi:hypothetical protein NC651_040312 [Populus alba x Populus x berolinensis]|nr:hypothetical protein NC651_040312 [Populus alba x Populus x berolinensis]